METLDAMLSDMDPGQRSGVFQLPEEGISNQRVIRYFLEHARGLKEHPLLVEEEKYTRQSAIIKLGENRPYASNRNLVRVLLDYNILRAADNQSPQVDHQGAPLDNLSFAQFISFAYQVPIEEVIFTCEELKKQADLKRLYNAYKGTSWFERFRRKYKRKNPNPRIVEWHDISTADLPRLLSTSHYESGDPTGNTTKLLMAGFILPRVSFKAFSPRNFIDNYSLAELASIVTGIERGSILVEDSYINILAENYIYNRLLPYMRKQRLSPDQLISLRKARHMTDMTSEILEIGLRLKPRKKVRFYSSKVFFPAIDLAIYRMKETKRLIFTREDVVSLFGMHDLDLERCGLYSNPNGTYARLQRVYPFYDKVSLLAKIKLNKRMPLIDSMDLMEDDDIYLMNGGKSYIVSERTRNSYARAYSLRLLDGRYLGHIASNLLSGVPSGEKIVCPEMILKIRRNEIFSVRINTRGYEGPIGQDT